MITINYRNGLCHSRPLLSDIDFGFVIQNVRSVKNPTLDRGVIVEFAKPAEGFNAISKLNSIHIPYGNYERGNIIIFRANIKCVKSGYDFKYSFDREYRIDLPDVERGKYITLADWELEDRLKNLYRKFLVSLAENISKYFGRYPCINSVKISHLDLDYSGNNIQSFDLKYDVTEKSDIGRSIEYEELKEFLQDSLFLGILCNFVQINQIKYSIPNLLID